MDKLSKIPTQWTRDETAIWLTRIGFGNYSENFIVHEISGEILPMLNESDLLQIGIYPIAHRKKILLRIRELQSFSDRIDPKYGDPNNFFELIKINYII
jgi:hypothetical protein